ncbi:hypothetical protein JQ625_27290 [Bradyrhizobium diazoefficiens]|nr:hypothetical protein [Bradyrhizobium diazoefficiens]MBR0778554.1 hypothetical protein [Bradyrhizobium diazoefficiens]
MSEENTIDKECIDRIRDMLKPIMTDTPPLTVLSSMMMVTAMISHLAASGDRNAMATFFEKMATGLQSGKISFARDKIGLN